MSDGKEQPILALQKYSREVFDGLEWQIETEVPAAYELIGSPTMRIAVLVGDGSSAGTIAAWSCDRDGFISKGHPAAEAAFLLEGHARLTDSRTGAVTDIRAGEGYSLPLGWAGSWEAITPVRKVYLLL